MFRAPQVLIWSSSTRPLQLGGSHLSVLCESSAAGGVKTWSCEHVGGSGAETQPTLSPFPCDDQTLREAPPEGLSPTVWSSCPLVSASASDRKCSAVKDADRKLRAVNQDTRPCRRPSDACQASLSLLFCRQHFTQHCTPWVLSHGCSRPSSPSPKARAVHQAACPVGHDWRDCLSLDNENRCRQSLGPNLKLYEANEGKKGASVSQGRSQGRWASVLVSLCSVQGEPAFLFTLRSSLLKGRHKGDVSFAGGKRDAADRDVVATALREAREELGVTVATEKVWGVLKPLRDMSGMLIAPVLANLGPLEGLSFRPNPGEVEEIFTVSLSHLCNPKNRGYTHFRTGDRYGYTLPVFRNGKHRVWGLTATALDHTLKLIVPPQPVRS